MQSQKISSDRARTIIDRPLPWCLAQNGVLIGRFAFQADCIAMIRHRISLIQDISRFRYWYEGVEQ